MNRKRHIVKLHMAREGKEMLYVVAVGFSADSYDVVY